MRQLLIYFLGLFHPVHGQSGFTATKFIRKYIGWVCTKISAGAGWVDQECFTDRIKLIRILFSTSVQKNVCGGGCV